MKVNEMKTFETIHDMLKWYIWFKCKKCRPHFSSHQVQPVDAAVFILLNPKMIPTMLRCPHLHCST